MIPPLHFLSPPLSLIDIFFVTHHRRIVSTHQSSTFEPINLIIYFTNTLTISAHFSNRDTYVHDAHP
jgi:hypothetical protein